MKFLIFLAAFIAGYALGSTKRYVSQLSNKELHFMYIVKDDNPDVAYTVSPGTAQDAEGNDISDSQLSISVESDNPDVVQITSNEDDRSGTVHFGKPGDANVTATVSDGERVLGKFGAQFHVTTGDPAQISGGSMAFDGLSESGQ